MPTSDLRFRCRTVYITLALSFLAVLAACQDEVSPPSPPASLEIVSGDAQYTKKGTKLEDPVVVRVLNDRGAPAAGMTAHFQIIEGGGSLSHADVATNDEGRASVRWTVGPTTGNNRLRITVTENTELTRTATATSAEYYCVEENPTFAAKFTPAHSFMMLTRASSLSPAQAGLARYDLNTGGVNVTFAGTLIRSYDENTAFITVRDCAFSANGDLFVSWVNVRNEVGKVAANGTVTHFATLDPPPTGTIQQGAELAMTPNGVLVGCDVVGPFYVTCRDSLFRFSDAIYTGDDITRDQANNDALACDPNSGDVYFIYKADRDLLRIPFDGTTAGSATKVADLSLDATDGGRGMVVDGTDGSIYILVESAATKSIIKVTSGGTVTTAYDFFNRGAGDAAGVQSDLAIDRQLKFLYTLDTKNNIFLAFGLPTSAQPGELVTISPNAGANEASDAASGERVGLDVIPAAGP